MGLRWRRIGSVGSTSIRTQGRFGSRRLPNGGWRRDWWIRRSAIRYESSLRLHVAPVFGRRQLRSIKPSEIAAWIADLDARFGPSTARTAFLVLHGTLELAVDDDTIKRNPAKARVVKVPSEKAGKVVVWPDEVVLRIAECHPPQYRPIATIGAASGLRQGELFGLAEEDIDFDEMVIHVRRQVKKLGREFVFALPKNDTERTVPLSEGAALILKEHIAAFKPRPYTLPWEKTDGKPPPSACSSGGPTTCTSEHARTTSWSGSRRSPKRALSRRLRRARVADANTPPTRGCGMHALRHYYASVTLADGVNIKELAEYLGHGDPGFTLRLYTHMLPSSHERARKAVDSRLSRLFSLKSHGAVTELAADRSPTPSWEPDGDPYQSEPEIGL